PVKEQSLEMNSDSLDAAIIADVMGEIVERRSGRTEDAWTVVAETQNLLQLIEANKKDEAIKYGHQLIGKLEVLLAKDPSLSLIPVDVNFQKNELITDIESVRDLVKSAQEAMDAGYYQLAGDLLENLHSEMIINSLYIPTATYPDAIKVAVASLEDGRTDAAKSILQEVLGTIVVEKTILPLPVLKAEQMVVEAAKVDSVNHENADKVINLLKNAEYQLLLAEEMGYGKKDAEYKDLTDAIMNIQKSVEEKSDSQSAFDSLKVKISKFKDRLFPKNKKEGK
ncbi:MAG: YfdX family protein, partial [Bacteroidales bacterium]|nr:YfdX family protein [Bacteroidales bacterium]